MIKPPKITKKVTREWKQRIQEAVHDLQERKPGMEGLVRRYSGKSDPTWARDFWIEVNKIFPTVELKKWQLFYRLPKINVLAEEVLTESMGDAQAAGLVAEGIEQAVNKKLGIHQLNAIQDIQKVIFDVLCPAGIGAVEIGYRTTIQEIVFKAGEPDPIEPEREEMVVDPETEEPIVDPETGSPAMEMVPNVLEQDLKLEVPVFEEYFFDHVPVSQLLVPRGFKDTDYDKAPWLGRKFETTLAAAKSKWDLPSDFRPTGNPEDSRFELDNSRRPKTDKVEGILIWYRAADYDSKVKNPHLFRKLVFINGMDKPVEGGDNVHQEVGPDGQLTPNSPRGNPIHVLTVRDMTDSAFPPSDAHIIRPAVDELSKGRTQQMIHRDRSLPMNWHDRNRVSPSDIQKWARGEIGASIPVDGNGSEVFGDIQRAQLGRESSDFDNVVNRDIAEMVSMGSNQRGVETSEKKSATEQSIVQANVDVRLDGERDRVMSWFLRGVTNKLVPLILRYTTEDQWVSTVGSTRGQAVVQWLSLNLESSLSFEILPDSGAHYDSVVRFANLKEFYEFTARDPNVNRVPVLREMATLVGLDPSEVIVEELPEEGPAPPSVSLRISGDDMNPAMPQFAVFREMLEQLGVKISEESIQRGMQANEVNMVMQQLLEAQGNSEGGQGEGKPQGHGGLAQKAEPLSKNSADETGGTKGLAGEGT